MNHIKPTNQPITNQQINQSTNHIMKQFIMACCCLCSLFLCNTQVKAQAAGTLDASFGVGGIARTSIPSINLRSSLSADIALQNDGKIINVGNSTTSELFITRHNSDGSLDATFGSNGIVTDRVLRRKYAVKAVAIQSNGKILVTGKIKDSTTLSTDIFVLRYNSNGLLDNTFGTGGKVLINNATPAIANDMIVQPDGKIVLTGTLFTAPNSVITIRINSNGGLDNSFGTGGKVIYTNIFSTQDVQAASIGLQSNGKIVIGAYHLDAGVETILFVLLRYNTDGTLDTTFGNYNGVARPNLNITSEGRYMIVQPDDKILFTGRVIVDPVLPIPDATVMRFTANGILDTSFGNNGLSKTVFLTIYQYNKEDILNKWSHYGRII
jgi:uncharacterized delta-60 repeat protein